MKDWYSGIYKGLICACVVAFLVGFFSNGNVSMDSYITGYSVLILAIMMILMILFNNVNYFLTYYSPQSSSSKTLS